MTSPFVVILMTWCSDFT